MSRQVQCRKYKTSLPGLEVPPYPGPKGEDIFNNVSQQAWEEWQAQQTMLINEKHLNIITYPDRPKDQQHHTASQIAKAALQGHADGKSRSA